MANTYSAKKRTRQNEKRRARNRVIKTRVRTVSKQVQAVVTTGDAAAAGTALIAAQSVIDRAQKRGVLHRRTAARRKSQLARRVNRLMTAPA